MNAITAKLGIDIEPLKQGLAKAEAMSVASSKRTAEAAKKLAKEAQESAKQLAEHGKGAASQLVNATSASELLGSGVEQVGAAFGALGAIAGVALGGAISKMGDAIDQAREMREAVAHAATPQGGPGFSTVGSINSHLSDAMATGGTLNDNLQHHVVRSAFMEALAGKGGNTAKNLSAQLDAVEKGAQADIGNLAAKKAQIASIDEKRVNLGERSAALAKVELDLEEAKGDALRLQTEAKNKGLVLNASPLIAQAEKDAAFKREEINRQAAAQERGMTLEGQLTSIRAEGNNAAVEAAEAREKAANADLAAAKGSKETAEATNRLFAAGVEVKEAKEARAIETASLAAQVKTAGIVGLAEDRHTAELKVQQSLLQDQLALATKADEKRHINAQLATVGGQIRDNNFTVEAARRERGFSVAGSLTDADKGRGASEEMIATARHLIAAKEHLAALNKSKDPSLDPATIAAAKANVKQLTNSLNEQAEARVRSLDVARDETAIMQATLDGATRRESLLKIELEYREKIRDALKDGNTELAGQLTKQKGLTIEALNTDIAQGGPAARQAAINAARAKQKAHHKATGKAHADANADAHGAHHRIAAGDRLLNRMGVDMGGAPKPPAFVLSPDSLRSAFADALDARGISAKGFVDAVAAISPANQ